MGIRNYYFTPKHYLQTLYEDPVKFNPLEFTKVIDIKAATSNKDSGYKDDYRSGSYNDDEKLIPTSTPYSDEEKLLISVN